MTSNSNIKDTNASLILPDQTCQRLTLAEIISATNNFDKSLVIGRGGFGMVYKSLTKCGSVNEVAIKRLNSKSNQGAGEFEAEVKLLSKVRHGNLVSLIGYCTEGNEMILAYEFMPNGTLEDHLHRGFTELSWLQLLNICIGAARGLEYLHTGTSTQHEVIHRDVKTSNILLDSNFAAKISDFGLAKVSTIDHARTHVSTLVKGTFGYMDPCYFRSGQLTRQSDVYAFGVVLFEVLTGKQAVDPTLDEDQLSLAIWAQRRIKEGKLNGIIDPRLMGQISKKGLKEFASIAVRCLHNQPKQRPTMAEVVVKLESILSREKESTGSRADDGRFFNKVTNFLAGKANNGTIRTFTYAELVSATDDWKHTEFKDSVESVHKGWVNELTYAPTKPGVGLAICVWRKRVTTSKPYLDLKPTEFNHPNLVKLLGYCLEKQYLFYVYKQIPGTGLHKLLFRGLRTPVLSWVARLKIALGAARGFSFLHEKGYPSYDQFKTTCILVEQDYNARLWNFEINYSCVTVASYFSIDKNCFAPERFRYQLDVLDGIYQEPFQESFWLKSAIYSFGVVLLELLTGMKVYDHKRPEGKQNLVEWATPLLPYEAKLGMILDKQLQDQNSPPKGAFMLAELVSNCLQPTPEKRPSMENILQVLHLVLNCVHNA